MTGLGLDCEHVREVAPDLALGLLTGRERAACLAHLEGCGACRAEVSALAVTADDVLLAGPRSAPPAGFDRRVLDRLARAGAFSPPDPAARPPDGLARTGAFSPADSFPPPDPGVRSPDGIGAGGQPGLRPQAGFSPEAGDGDGFGARGQPGVRPPVSGRRGVGDLAGGGRARPRPRRRGLAAAVLAAAIVVAAVAGVAAAGGFAGLGGRHGTASAPAVATAEMRTGTGHLVGDVTVRGDDPSVVTVELPGWSDLVRMYGGRRGTYWLAVELDDGSRTMNRIPPGDTAWEVPLRAAAGDVAAVSVVDAGGRAWCSGRFPA
jgi:Putative zinc-finger